MIWCIPSSSSKAGNSVGYASLAFFFWNSAGGALTTEFPTLDEEVEMHQIMTHVEPLLEASGYWTGRNISMTNGKYRCHCLAQTLWLFIHITHITLTQLHKIFTHFICSSASDLFKTARMIFVNNSFDLSDILANLTHFCTEKS